MTSNKVKTKTLVDLAFQCPARYIEIDGTLDRLRDIVRKHDLDIFTVSGTKTVTRAGLEIARYIDFKNSINVYYYDPVNDRYVNSDGSVKNLDYVRGYLPYRGERLYLDQKVADPTLATLICMLNEDNRITHTDNVTDAERERRLTYGTGIYYMLAKMLDGYSYFPDL